MDPAETTKFVEQAFPNAREAICEFIRIPNQSPAFEKNWAETGHTKKAVDLLVNWVKGRKVPGLHLEVLQDGARTPLIFLEMPASSGFTDQSTVLMYGHLDKQPPLLPWAEGLNPYDPVERDGKLYGRGAADDGYSIFAAVLSIEAMLAQKKAHPKILIMIEACEESGSPDLPHYVQSLKSKLGDVRLVVCLDSGCGTYTQMWLTSSLRGVLGGTLKVTALKEGMHSGAASGIVADTFRVARQLLDRIEDQNTGRVKLNELFVQIPDWVTQSAKEAANLLGDDIWKENAFVNGAGPITRDHMELILNKTWRPQLAITGQSGLPTIEASGNVLRAFTYLRLSMRIPPQVDPIKGAEAMKRTLEANPPYGYEVKFEYDKTSAGWAAPALAPYLEHSLKRASESFFHNPLMMWGEGGTIPFMQMLGEQYPKAQFVVTGVLGAGSNAHGPNEFLHLPYTKKLIACVAHVLADHGSHLADGAGTPTKKQK